MAFAYLIFYVVVAAASVDAHVFTVHDSFYLCLAGNIFFFFVCFHCQSFSLRVRCGTRVFSLSDKQFTFFIRLVYRQNHNFLLCLIKNIYKWFYKKGLIWTFEEDHVKITQIFLFLHLILRMFKLFVQLSSQWVKQHAISVCCMWHTPDMYNVYPLSWSVYVARFSITKWLQSTTRNQKGEQKCLERQRQRKTPI